MLGVDSCIGDSSVSPATAQFLCFSINRTYLLCCMGDGAWHQVAWVVCVWSVFFPSTM